MSDAGGRPGGLTFIACPAVLTLQDFRPELFAGDAAPSTVTATPPPAADDDPPA